MASKDIYFTRDGDLFFGEDNTMNIVSSNNNELFVSQIYRRLLSRSSDWISQDVIAANLHEFFGFPLNKYLLGEIKRRIFNTLTRDGLMTGDDFTLSVMVVNTNHVLILLNVNKTTDENNAGSPIRISLNTSSNRVEAVPIYYDDTLTMSSLED
jgi:hypothetical protein